MSDDIAPYFEVGKPLAALTTPLAVRVHQAACEDQRFNVIELRRLEGGRPGEAIIVDCRNGAVPSKNRVGIEYTERLALVFWCEDGFAPEVWALRRSFPETEHMYAVAPGSPCSLCIYFEPWPVVRRTWTGHKHLARIARWLADVAAGELHRADQPVEQFYFNAPWELVLPAGVVEAGVPTGKVLLVHRQPSQRNDQEILIARVSERRGPEEGTRVSAAVLTVEPVVSGHIERPARTLGELHAQLERRGSGLIRPLVDEVNRQAEGVGIPASTELGLIVVRVPIRRTPGGDIEAWQIHGFMLQGGLGTIGAALGILAPAIGGQHHRAARLGAEPYAVDDDWRRLAVQPVAILVGLTAKRARQLTGVDTDSSEFRGTLIGGGSLGGALGDIWARMAWGTWTVVDDDLLKPHNVPRHRAMYGHVGLSKAPVVAALMNECVPEREPSHSAIAQDVMSGSTECEAALTEADLIVDCSTSLHVPRDLAQRGGLPRIASAFLTPSGQSCVLLMEDKKAEIRMDALEAQYYRVLIRADWGDRHLAGHRADELWVGAGCREVTTVLSPELVALHAGILSSRIRHAHEQGVSLIGVWGYDEDSGAVSASTHTGERVVREQCGEWTIAWDAGLSRTMHDLRSASLPRETGGVLIGYIDQPLKTIYLVDALPASADSDERPAAFERGVEGLAEKVNRISRLTAGLVGYVGEWHAHPDGFSIDPSQDDVGQLVFLAAHLRQEGQPALIVIIGDGGERTVLGEVVSA